MKKNPNTAIIAWLSAGLLGFLLLPWYTIHDTAWYQVLGQIFAGPETANGLVQALEHQRPWLLFGLIGLGIAGLGLCVRPGRTQGAWLLAGGLLGLAGLLFCGFAIGARGWSYAPLAAAFGELASNQFGMGAGAFVVLLALLVLTAFGLARVGYFNGDLFIAASVLTCSALLALFIAFPVAKALSSAFIDETGQWSLLAIFARVGDERIWSLSCLAGGLRCGVAWNTLFLALACAAGTTVLGTLMALLAERSAGPRMQSPLRVIALLPIFAEDILKIGPEGLGYLRAAPSIGALLTMIALTKFPPTQHAWRNMLLAVAGFGLFTVLFAFSHHLWLSLFALAMTGACDSISVVIRQTILQIYPPENMRGRVAAVNGMFVSSSNELGAFESGLAAKYMGTITATLLGGCMTMAVVAVSWAKTKDLFNIDIGKSIEK